MTDFERAKEWLKPYAAKWQVLNRGEWKYAFHEKTLVRYLEEVKMDEALVVGVLDYLKSDECVADLSLYDQKIAATWKPTRAWLEVSNKAVGNIKGVRLYHALIDASEKSGQGDGAYLIENGCAYKVSHTFFFNQPNPPTDADMAGKYKSTSGVSYQVGSLGVNPDTGLWNYVIEKRERVQQDIAKYTTAKTIFEQQEEEVHHGVKKDKVESTGKKAGVNNGVITRRKLSKNGDCTTDVHNTYETEIEVKGASESVTVTRTGSTIETTNRNVASPLATKNLKVGESVTNTKTPGGKWNTVYRKHVKNALNWIAEACTKTIFSHSHSKTTNQSEDPGFTHTEEAANGVIVKKSVRAENDGSFTITEDVEEEQTVNNAAVSKRVTLGGTEVREEHRNLKEEPNAADLKVGESLTVSKTPGGLWNAVKTKFVAKAIDKIRESCSQNLFSHTHSSTKIVTEDPGFSHAMFTANGVVTRVEVTKNENGTWTMTTSTEEEKSVPSASVSVQKTLHGTIRREEARGQRSPLSEGGLSLGESVTNTKTPNGLYNTSKTSPSITGGGKIAESKSENYFTKSGATTENKSAASGMVSPSVTFSQGKITQKSVQLESDGTQDVHEQVTEAKEWQYEERFHVAKGLYVRVIRYGNKKTRPRPVLNTSSETASYNDNINEFKLHYGTITISPIPAGKNSSSWTYTKHGPTVTTRRFRTDKFGRVWKKDVTEGKVFRCAKYSDYVDDLANNQPDIGYTDGVHGVKLIRGPFSDSFGNLYAEWSYEKMSGDSGAWQRCTWSDIRNYNGKGQRIQRWSSW